MSPVFIGLKGGCTRFEVEHIYHVTYYCILEKHSKNWDFFWGKFYSPPSTLKLAAYMRTSKHYVKSPYIGCYFRVL